MSTYYGFITEDNKWKGDKIDYEAFQGKRVCITVREVKDKRTDMQNAYLHAILNILWHETGTTVNEWKSYFKYSFLFKELTETVYPDQEFYNYDITTYLHKLEVERDPKIIKAESSCSTSNLDRATFSKLTTFIRDYASVNQITYIMTPEEYYEAKGKKYNSK